MVGFRSSAPVVLYGICRWTPKITTVGLMPGTNEWLFYFTGISVGLGANWRHLQSDGWVLVMVFARSKVKVLLN